MRWTRQTELERLACPDCRAGLHAVEEGLVCSQCLRAFEMRSQVPVLLPARSADGDLLAQRDGQTMVRAYRAPNRLVQAMRRVISSEFFPGKDWRRRKAEVLRQASPLVIGSGVSHYPGALHLDLDAFPGVDVVGDAHQLPLKSACVDGLVCEVVLEHVQDAHQVLEEAWRVLQPGGLVFFLIPFVFPYHGHPGDYRRWSRMGLETLFSRYDHLEVGIHGGPSSSFVNLITEYIYVLSGSTYPRGYTLVKGLATALLFPLKFLDVWANRLPEAHRLASTFYVFGRKPKAPPPSSRAGLGT